MKYLFLLLTCLLAFGLAAHDDEAVIGIRANEIDPKKAEMLGYPLPYGSRVDRIYPGSPAQAAGLQPLDYIYQVNDERVNSRRDLDDLLEGFQPGDKISIGFYRDGESMTKALFLSRRGDLSMPHRPDSEDPFLGISQIHEETPEGIVGTPITVVHNSTAQAMGLQRGDIITAVDGYTVADWHDLSPMIDMREVGDEIRVAVYRDGETFTRSRPIKSQAATHGDHSRPNGPQVIQPQPSADNLPPIAQVELAPVTRAEATALPIAVSNPAPERPTVAVEPVAKPTQPLIRELAVESLNIFPNPTTGIFDIRFELPQRGETSVFIYNPAGQALYFNTLGDFSGVFSDRIDIANGVRGIYFLEVRQGQRSLTRKVILQ